jgi:osmotically-inducible protein OsmY
MSNRHDPDYPSREPPSRDPSSREYHASRESRDYGSSRGYGSRDSSREYGPREYGSREYDPRNYGSREAGEYGRAPDLGRRDERYWQTSQQRDDDYSASDYRSSRYTVDDRNDHRNPSRRHARQDRDENDSGHDSSGYSGAPFYAAGYTGPGYYGSSPLRDSGRYPEHSSSAERYPYVRGTVQERAWSRDPRNGEIHGYDYEARWPASGAGSDVYHQPVRWRAETELGNREARPGNRGWGMHESSRFGQSGKGPKGYVRSDERIREDVSDRLSDDDELDASDITVTVVSGEVRLEGTVLDRYSKHRAEDLADSVSGVRDVSNNLRTRKGFLREMGDKLIGDDRSEHRGHSGSGTHNAPQQGSAAPQSSPQQNATTQNSPLQSSTKGGLSANR